ncbi:hypothetical protein ASPVEDRAFT_742476 [Aspergillus versicolor CBS 583.65]|uniref:Uncharacterized protein n=1 Tax=Aspergillus versicolor CBS 583.65 TaxID=1036611 RepID=A0A1L9PQ39_ASPVE|nr:uncharacterized protein ASPVEDRAFT_742476 [Aspergillus versicolor CBS 583.65]OJJ03621.1 hypothetical protein ASPVEDRAFT_742476 [Aspergillus versicolor CBS 583.65]
MRQKNILSRRRNRCNAVPAVSGHLIFLSCFQRIYHIIHVDVASIATPSLCLRLSCLLHIFCFYIYPRPPRCNRAPIFSSVPNCIVFNLGLLVFYLYGRRDMTAPFGFFLVWDGSKSFVKAKYDYIHTARYYYLLPMRL